jgi:hypothetical protein
MQMSKVPIISGYAVKSLVNNLVRLIISLLSELFPFITEFDIIDFGQNKKYHTVGTNPKSRKTKNTTLSEQIQNQMSK